MCNFPSWEETVGGKKEIIFLTDKEAKQFNLNDAVGHSAIEEIFPDFNWNKREGYPCPKEFAKAINDGKCNWMMGANGYKKLHIDKNGFPDEIVMKKNASLDLYGCAGLKSLPEGLKVNGSLDLSYCTGLKSLLEGLKVRGYLDLHGCTGLKNLPEGLEVDSWLDLHGCTGLKGLPKGLKVRGYLDLYGCTGLKSLPEGLKVGGSLNLCDCTGLRVCRRD